MRIPFLLLPILLLCGSCATTQADLAALKQFTLEDIRRAVEINTAAEDEAGLQCSQGLLAILQEQDATLPEPVGVVSAAARVRAFRLSVQNGRLLERLNIACAAAFVDAAYTYSKLLLSLGVKVAVPGP